jgi:hypothetical protein
MSTVVMWSLLEAAIQVQIAWEPRYVKALHR